MHLLSEETVFNLTIKIYQDTHDRIHTHIQDSRYKYNRVEHISPNELSRKELGLLCLMMLDYK